MRNRAEGVHNMEKRELTCIGCPMGCLLEAQLEGDKVLSISGNTCRRGEVYAQKELTNPTRIVTTTVRTRDGGVIPVKTAADIPKGSIMDCMKELKALTVEGSIQIGQVILEDAAGTGVNVVATASRQVGSLQFDAD